MNTAKVSVILKTKSDTEKFVQSFCNFAIKHDFLTSKSESDWELDLIKVDESGNDKVISNFDVLRILEWADTQNYILSCTCRLND